jgi:hypothetical protein
MRRGLKPPDDGDGIVPFPDRSIDARSRGLICGRDGVVDGDDVAKCGGGVLVAGVDGEDDDDDDVVDVVEVESGVVG